MDSFPFDDVLSLNILRQFWGPMHRFTHFYLRGLKGVLYAQELQKVHKSDDIYKIEKILAEKRENS